MFVNTIDNKSQYVNKDGVSMIDLTKSIFKQVINNATVFTYYRVAADMEMRPDKISQALYGDIDYAEMVMKYSSIDNPFAIQTGDILAVPSITMVYSDVDDVIISNGIGDDITDKFVKNYHKYIDKDKLPASKNSTGSGDIYSGGNNSIASRQILSSTGGTGSAELNIGIQNPLNNDLSLRESYGNVMGYGSDYNLTDGLDDGYSGGNSDYYGVNNLDDNGYPVRDDEYGNRGTANGGSGTSGTGSGTGSGTSGTGNGTTGYNGPSSGAGGNGLNGGFNDGQGSGKSGNVLNNDIFNGVNGRGTRGYGQGNGGYANGRPSTGIINGISYDDDDNILTETLYDENGNEVPINSGFDEMPVTDYGPKEPNMGSPDKPGITISNGRIFFGDPNDCNTISSGLNDITDTKGTNKVDDPLVDCARTGVSIGQFLNATLKNKVESE